MSTQEEQTPKVDEVEKVNDNEKTEQKNNEEEIGKITSDQRRKKHYFLFLDIDLNDPEVEAAAAKIQSAFKFRMKGKKN